MRVLVLATDIFSKGGIQKYTKYLITALKELYGYRNIYVASFLAGKYKELEEIHADLIGGQLNFFTKIKFTIQGLYSIKKWKIDLIICNHVSLAPIANTAKKFFSIRYGVIVHGIEVWGKLKHRELAGLKNADIIFPVSNFTKGKLENVHGINPEKMFILRNCIDTKKFFPKKPDRKLTTEHDLLDKKIPLTVGRLVPGRDKGHDKVIRAIKRVRREVPEVVYLVVGSGSDRTRLEGITKRLDLQNHVHFIGFVSDDLLPKYYNLCDLFVMPSGLRNEKGEYAGEGFGIVYLEANACEKPVIAGKYGGSAEAVMDGKTGILVDPDNIDEIANSIVKLLLNEKLAKEMGRKGRERVLNQFSYETVKKDVKRLFNDKLLGLRE